MADAADRSTPLVLKIGGSLLETGTLGPLLGRLMSARRNAPIETPLVLVPGGGPFADAVRAAQKELRFSDRAAHRMAILAMHQMAEIFLDLQPGLAPAETVDEMRLAWSRRRAAVWLPFVMSAGDAALPENWTVTSDALAARLAERLGTVCLVLLKSAQADRGLDADGLARAGVVDPVFAAIVRRAGLDWRVLGPADWCELERLL